MNVFQVLSFKLTVLMKLHEKANYIIVPMDQLVSINKSAKTSFHTFHSRTKMVNVSWIWLCDGTLFNQIAAILFETLL